MATAMPALQSSWDITTKLTIIIMTSAGTIPQKHQLRIQGAGVIKRLRPMVLERYSTNSRLQRSARLTDNYDNAR